MNGPADSTPRRSLSPYPVLAAGVLLAVVFTVGVAQRSARASESPSQAVSAHVPDHVKSLVDELLSDDATIRSKAAYELGRLTVARPGTSPDVLPPSAPVATFIVPYLISRLWDDAALAWWPGGRTTSPGEEAAIALVRIGPPSVLPLIRAMDALTPVAKNRAIWALKEITLKGFGDNHTAWKQWWSGWYTERPLSKSELKALRAARQVRIHIEQYGLRQPLREAVERLLQKHARVRLHSTFAAYYSDTGRRLGADESPGSGKHDLALRVFTRQVSLNELTRRVSGTIIYGVLSLERDGQVLHSVIFREVGGLNDDTLDSFLTSAVSLMSEVYGDDVLISALEYERWLSPAVALELLVRAGAGVSPALVAMLHNTRVYYSEEMRVLSSAAPPTTIGTIHTQLRDIAAQALGKIGERRAVPHLISGLESSDSRSGHYHLFRALEQLTGNRFGTDAAHWKRWWKENEANWSRSAPCAEDCKQMFERGQLREGVTLDECVKKLCQ